jgi:hypothetical protein
MVVIGHVRPVWPVRQVRKSRYTHEGNEMDSDGFDLEHELTLLIARAFKSGMSLREVINAVDSWLACADQVWAEMRDEFTD